MLTKLLTLTLCASAAADVKLQRTVNALDPTFATATLNVDSGCASKDAFGSNDCDFAWGTTHTVAVDAALKKDVDATYTIHADLKLEAIFPLKFSCAACGATCSFEVPIIHKHYSFDTPACPIKATELTQSFTKVLPATSPVPLEAKFKGTIALTNATSTVIELAVEGELK